MKIFTPKKRDIAARWTPALIAGGFTPISDFFLDNYHRLSPPISHAEAMFIAHLMRHKWDASAPYPSLKSIAMKMGVSPQAARLYARNLEKKGYLRREMMVGETNRFHLPPLFQALEALQQKSNSAKVVRIPGTTNTSAIGVARRLRQRKTNAA